MKNQFDPIKISASMVIMLLCISVLLLQTRCSINEVPTYTYYIEGN